MRVLDVGSGAGDVAFLAAELVGESGEVVGVDRSAIALDLATRRAAANALRQVSFLQGDPAELAFEQPFDAVVGRYVLQFQKDPATMLRKLGAHLKPGGFIVFHEIDWGGPRSLPPVPTFDRCCAWGRTTLERHGTETRMGMKLYPAFVAAGLPPPRMRLESIVAGGSGALELLQRMVDLMVTLLPEMERLGVASAAEVGLDSLLDRLLEETIAGPSVIIGLSQVAAWCRV
jgi:SAM-dependent methyltransferase